MDNSKRSSTRSSRAYQKPGSARYHVSLGEIGGKWELPLTPSKPVISQVGLRIERVSGVVINVKSWFRREGSCWGRHDLSRKEFCEGKTLHHLSSPLLYHRRNGTNNSYQLSTGRLCVKPMPNATYQNNVDAKKQLSFDSFSTTRVWGAWLILPLPTDRRTVSRMDHDKCFGHGSTSIQYAMCSKSSFTAQFECSYLQATYWAAYSLTFQTSALHISVCAKVPTVIEVPRANFHTDWSNQAPRSRNWSLICSMLTIRDYLAMR